MIHESIRDMEFDDYLALIRDFTDNELIAREPEMVRAGAVPDDLVRRMAEAGLFGITLPTRHGGLGWSVEQQALLTMEFTRASVVYRSRFSTTIGLASQALLDHGTEQQRERYLSAMAAGECVAAFALTEPEAGSDASALSTTARRTTDGYVLDGHKRFITNAAWADVLLVFARTDPDDAALSAFFVDRTADGVTVRLPERMNGHAEGPVAEIELSGVRVGPETLLGGVEGRGLRQALRGINHARTHVAATAVGQATRILAEATGHATDREQFGRPVAEFGAVQAMLGRSYAELEAGRALVLDCAREFDAGFPPRERISAAKLYCTEMASEVADRAVQILGGDGIVGDNPVPRMWRDVRALRIYEGTSQIHERNLARALPTLLETRKSTS
ncbi:acyl-CoA dehydrogenase family protein [Streptomyces purpurogeneiscleroticus]|uniref:acyl-CoA dehydrogenase family protein n=1 Tax=Streptomyces purpurogeneiscleroticus TaxID=68259 RepID=UPI001CBAD66F|nr:acyl-CoA dehydrogenase family protein [Streptomyces purpurogeneiscleroticus]MBZ4017170.1 acyl-CoA dehydrogenase [Streptomyces purpurogeneiscleroticus]